MTRTIHAVSFALLISIAHLCADASAAPPNDEAAPPVIVKVTSLTVVDAGEAKGDPRASFGLVNREQGTCYAIAPPSGPTIEVGESYTVISASNIDDAMRTKLRTDYPKCAIVDVVGRSVR